jgi:branched-chain amino acid transport system permease protein
MAPLGAVTTARAARAASLAAALLVGWIVLDHLLPRHLPLGIIVIGLVFGSIQALTAVGIVLIYRASRVVNFAQADLGVVAAVLAVLFKLRLHVPYFLAIAMGVAMALVTGALIDLLIIRRFRDAPRLIVAVATIGLSQILTALGFLIPTWWKAKVQTGSETFATPFNFNFTIFPVRFIGDHVLAILVVLAVLIALALFLRLSDYGVAMRAAPENAERAQLLGLPVGRLATISWSLAGLLSALAVILRVPLLGFSTFAGVAGAGPSLLLRTLAAAVIGRMQNIPVTVAAAIGLGIAQEGLAWTLGDATKVDAILVGVILVALLVQRGHFARTTEAASSTFRSFREVRPIPEELRGLPEVRLAAPAVGIALLGVAALIPVFASPSHENLFALIFIYAIIAISLVVLTGWAGQMSLGQFSLAGFGGAAAATLLMKHGWDLFLALGAGMVVTAALALVIGIPALRITGPYLAVTTLAFAVTSQTYFLRHDYFPWFVDDSILVRPALFGGRLHIDRDWQMYYVCLLGLLATLWAARNLRRTRTGRAMVAARDNEEATRAAGLDVTRLKLKAFAISGAMAGFAGGLYVLHQYGIKIPPTGATANFGPAQSLQMFSMVVIGGLGSLPGAILGAVYVRGLQILLRGQAQVLASGIGLLFLIMVLPGGLGELLYNARDWLLRLVAKRHGVVVPSLVADMATKADEPEVTFGALAAAGARGSE